LVGRADYFWGVRISDFDFDLPPEQIAQHPASRRDASRLLVLHRASGRIEHRRFPDVADYLNPGDLLVLNNSRVLPARLRGVKLGGGGGRIEALLVRPEARNDWWVLLRPGKRVRPGTRLRFGPEAQALEAEVVEKNAEGHCRLRFTATEDVLDRLEAVIGRVPLPPYIRGGRMVDADIQDYQTVYASCPGAVAAPTAGLHFTEELLDRLRAKGVETAFVTLHVGLGTFAPVKAERVEEHVMHAETADLPADTAEAVNRARRAGRRVVAVGTTSVRALESAAARSEDGDLQPWTGETRLFIRPPHTFHVTDVLLTNFHLPRSTLLMLVSAFAAPGETRGRELVLDAYAEAVRAGYRFFSYGDAMLLL